MTLACPTSALWLLADLGGTYIRFALANPLARNPLLLDSIRSYRVERFESLVQAAQQYAGDGGVSPRNAVFAVAGLVQGDAVQMTNHPWNISVDATRTQLGLHQLIVRNDFSAQAAGLPYLEPHQAQRLGLPEAATLLTPLPRTVAVLGPGTGLGVAGLLLRGGLAQVIETEGGHTGFAPTTAQEVSILQHLSERFGRVSNERLVCGSGLVNIYQAVCALAAQPASTPSPEQISARALAGSDPLSLRSVEVFCSVLASVAGDTVLALGAWDGVYLAGGLVPVVMPWLRQDAFRQRFENKGRFSSALAKVPVLAIMHSQPGLLGAAAIAVTAAKSPAVQRSYQSESALCAQATTL